MRVLVTGAAGFIGSNYVHHLLTASAGVEVVSLDALTYAGTKENLDGVFDDSRHEFVEGDVRDESLVGELVAGVDSIVHFAAESHVDRSIDTAAPFISTNIEGTRVLLDASRDTELDCFLQMSTDEVYGEIENGCFEETGPLDPRNPYAASKAGADHLAKSYHTTYDIPVKIVRSSNNFGPRQHQEKLIPKFIDRAIRGESLPLYGDGSNVREWTFVTDTCRAIETVREAGTIGEIYNVGSGAERTNLSVAKAILHQVGASEDLITFVEDRPGHDTRYALDTTKIESLGWEPTVSFQSGLERTIDHYTGQAE
jgi:dTDP-glucose 4,6-dehydratase